MMKRLHLSFTLGFALALASISGASAQCSGQFQPGRVCGNAGASLGLPGPILVTPSLFQPIAGGTVLGNPTGAAAVPIATAAPVLGIPGSVQGSIGLAGASSGTVTVKGVAASGTYNFNLPVAAGASGQAMLSGGGGAAAMTFGTLQVPAGGTGLVSGASGGVPYFDSSTTMASSGLLTANRIVLGGGAGVAPGVMAAAGSVGQVLQSSGASAPTFSAATYPSTTAINQLLYSSSANVVAGLATVNGGLLNAGATGTPALTVAPVLGVPGSSTGSMGFAGVTSGTATITPQAAAGTPVLTLPNASGTFAVNASSPLVLSGITGALTCPTCVTSSGGGAITGVAPISVSGAGAVSITGSALTKTDDTNVTMTLGGAPTTALISAASMTLGWTGQLSLPRGGTAASLTASNGGIVWSNATQMQILAGTATARLPLLSGATATPIWGSFTLPASVTSGGVAYFSSASAMSSSALLTANAIMLGGGAGVAPATLGSLGSTTTVLHGNAGGAPTFGAVVNADLATMAAYTFKGNVTGSAAIPTDFTIGSLTQKVSPTASDLVIIQDQAASGQVKYALVSAIAGAGTVASINGNVGAFTLNATSGITNSTNDILCSASSSTQFGCAKPDNVTLQATAGVYSFKDTSLTNSLASNVPIASGAGFTDGPTVAQGTSGAWFASGAVTLIDSVSAVAFFCKLWDGTTTIASNVMNTFGAGGITTVALSGRIASPAGNIRISCRGSGSNAAFQAAIATGGLKDSTVTAFRLQ